MADHDGSVFGQSTALCFFPDDDLAVVLMNNGGFMDPCFDAADRILFKDSDSLKNLASAFNEKKASDSFFKDQIAAHTVVPPPLPLDSYTGKYQNSVAGTLTIRKGSFGLEISLRDDFVPGRIRTLVPWNGNNFALSTSITYSVPSPFGPFATFTTNETSVVQVQVLGFLFNKVD
jgi:hypothetical protein